MEHLERNADPKVERLDPSALAHQERWNRFEKYVTLALKRNDERLTPAEFAELSVLELEQTADQIPPIENVFDADVELKRIRELPREEKTDAITVFKDTLMRQREAIMECRLALERTIEWNPDIPPMALVRIVDFFADNWGFSKNMVETAKSIVQEYVVARHGVVALRQQFPDNAQLVSKLAGFQFKDSGAFDIEVGPMSIDITTDGVHAKRMYPALSVQEKKGHQSAGYQSESGGGVLYTVTITDALANPENTLVHEREHAKNAIVMDLFDDRMRARNSFSLTRQLEKEKDPVLRKNLTQAIARNDRNEALHRAKNEIIAMIKDGKSIYFDLLFKRDGNPYDYLKGMRDAHALSPDPVERSAGTEILVNEYEHILHNGFSAVDMLSEAGYDANKTIALFTDIDIQHWPAMARRLTASKK